MKQNYDYKKAYTQQRESEYTKQGNDFLDKHGIKFDCFDAGHDVISKNDKDMARFAGMKRNKYTLQLSRNEKNVSFEFKQSIHNSNLNNSALGRVYALQPVAYDLLSCITKYDVRSFKDFCGDFGYDDDSMTAFKTYQAVCEEWEKVKSFFTPKEIEELQEIN